MRAVVSRFALLAMVAACGDPAARVRLVPVEHGACGRPHTSDVASLRVIAYTAGGEHPKAVPLDATGQVDISDFPADTLQLGVELSGPAGVIAAGKTEPLAFDSLPDGATIPIAILPLGGGCDVGGPSRDRREPLIARAGDGVLIAGGADANGNLMSDAEYFDPVAQRFTPVAIPPELVDSTNGLAGGVLTPLPDGKVALTGTAAHAIAVFDPVKLAFGTPQLFDHRAFHSAIALAQDRLFVIGGCAEVIAGACSGPALHSSFVYHLDDLTMRDVGPLLPDGSLRVDAQLFDLGPGSDGVTRYALVGGSGDPGVADRFAITDTQVVTLAGTGAHATELDGQALLTAWAPDGQNASGAASQLAPEAAAPVAVAMAPAVSGGRLVTLEDGSVLALAQQSLLRYVPTVNAWLPITPATAANADVPTFGPGQELVRLVDGSVLSIAGSSAWQFRPSLVGPTSGLLVVEPDGTSPGVLVPADPSTATHGGGQLSLAGDPAPALVGGFRSTTGSVNAAVRVTGDSLALVAQQQGPGRALVGELVAGSAARIVRRAGGADTTLCTGQVVPAFDPSLVTSVGLAVTGHTAVLSIATMPLATCDLSADPDAADSGAWGITSLGGTRLDLATITVSK